MAKLKDVKDLTGQKFNRWTVIRRAEDRYSKRGDRLIYWCCKCDCKKEKEVDQRSLQNEKSKSCGCLQKEIVAESGKNNRQPFKYQIGQQVKTNKGSITITNRIRDCKKGKGKFYFYDCNICGYSCDENHVINEKTLEKGHGCSICGGGSAVQKGINDIGTTAPWMMNFLKNINDGFTHSYGSDEITIWHCPCCNYEFKKSYAKIYNNGFHCPKCDDGYSFPEKFMLSVLTQLKVEFIFQLTHTVFEWCGIYKYDFYLPHYNIIIETHGEQHYSNRGRFKSLTLEEQQEIDSVKMNLAVKNNINYIIIDCRNSNQEWIKKSILDSDLSKLFDLSKIDFNLCSEYATKNIIKEVCDYYMNNDKPSTIDISSVFHIHYGTVRNYLLQGVNLGWCNYNPKEALVKSRQRNKNKRSLEAWYEGLYLGKFNYSGELISYAKINYNIDLRANSISEACRGIIKSTKGFICKYI